MDCVGQREIEAVLVGLPQRRVALDHLGDVRRQRGQHDGDVDALIVGDHREVENDVGGQVHVPRIERLRRWRHGGLLIVVVLVVLLLRDDRLDRRLGRLALLALALDSLRSSLTLTRVFWRNSFSNRSAQT